MREILFRGWDAEGRKGWVYGDLVHNKKCNREEPFLTDRVMVGGYEVIPESVGQYTGLKDRDGEKIFEGDIIGYNCYICDDDPEVYCEQPVTFTDGVFCMDEDWSYPLENAIYDAEEFDGVNIVGNEYERIVRSQQKK